MSEFTELIRKKGTIEGLIALQEDGEMTQSEMMDRMQVANGTIQRRLDELKSEDLIAEDASLAESGRPRKTYHLTDEGSKRAEKLRELLDEKEGKE